MDPAPLSSNECAAAAAYYFPVTHYVTSHFGMVETGVGHLEDIILSEGDLLGHTGADDELQVHNEAEAEGGDKAWYAVLVLSALFAWMFVQSGRIWGDWL